MGKNRFGREKSVCFDFVDVILYIIFCFKISDIAMIFNILLLSSRHYSTSVLMDNDAFILTVASQVLLVVKNLLASAGDTREGLIRGSREDPLEQEVATHSNILCWKIPLIEERMLMNNTVFILTVPLIVVLKTHMPEYCSDKGTISVILVPLDCETFAPCFISLHMFQCLLLYGLWDLEQNLCPAFV